MRAFRRAGGWKGGGWNGGTMLEEPHKGNETELVHMALASYPRSIHA